MSNFTDSKRARLGPARRAMEAVLGENECENILQPLWPTKGLIWPYTPTVSFGGIANYGSFHFTHNNYQYYQYQNSAPLEIQITGQFTSQTNEEARYMLAVLRFLRTVQMIEFGLSAADKGIAGTPPPVLRFNYLGAHMMNNVPVIVQTFNYILEDNIDYVEVKLPGGPSRFSGVGQAISDSVFGDVVLTENQRTYVPTRLTVSTTMMVQQNTRNVRENFDLDAFKKGDLLNKGFV